MTGFCPVQGNLLPYVTGLMRIKASIHEDRKSRERKEGKREEKSKGEEMKAATRKTHLVGFLAIRFSE